MKYQSEPLDDRLDEVKASVMRDLDSEIERLRYSGGYDAERLEALGRAVLPKVLVKAALRNVTENVMLPDYVSAKAAVENLKHF